MKNQLVILIIVLAHYNCFAQSIVNCNNVTYYTDTLYVSINNNVFSDTIYYNDTVGMAYPTHCLFLSDTSIVSATTTFSSDSCFIFTGLQQNSFDDTVHFQYLITFKSTTFTNNTIVNGFFHLSKITSNDTIVDCYSLVTIILQNSTGINDISANDEIRLYPNPVVNELNIKNNYFQLIEVTLYNSLGEKIISKSLTNKTSTIDLSGYSSGLYFYKLLVDNNLFKIGKIIKQ